MLPPRVVSGHHILLSPSNLCHLNKCCSCEMSPGMWLSASTKVTGTGFRRVCCQQMFGESVDFHPHLCLQVICTSISHLIHFSSPELCHRRIIESFQFRIQLCTSNLLCIVYKMALFSFKTKMFSFVMVSIKPCSLCSPPSLCHTLSCLPHPAPILRGISELWGAGVILCSYQPPVTTEVQMGVCSSSFQESVTGCYSDKQVGLLGKGTKN